MLSLINIILSAILALVAIFGDYLVIHTKLNLFQAIFDNATHAIIGGLSWLIVRINYKNTLSNISLIEISMCSLIASLIDLDHFFSARSVSLKAATTLQHRPPLHCSTIPLLLCLVLLIIGYILNHKILKIMGLIILTAFASHHTRDATRRGYWLYPFGSTQAIPYAVYVTLTCLIPYLIDEDSIYITVSVLGTIDLILLICMIILFYWIVKLRSTVRKLNGEADDDSLSSRSRNSHRRGRSPSPVPRGRSFSEFGSVSLPRPDYEKTSFNNPGFVPNPPAQGGSSLLRNFTQHQENFGPRQPHRQPHGGYRDNQGPRPREPYGASRTSINRPDMNLSNLPQYLNKDKNFY